MSVINAKKIEESNRMGKTRDLFRKIRDTKGAFHAKMGSIKERNGRDLTEAEDTKKRCPSDGFLTRLTSLPGLLQLCIRLCTYNTGCL